jgi:hypothetical protein
MAPMEKELEHLGKYLSDLGSENAKDYLVFPLFKELSGDKFKKQTDARGADIYVKGQLLVELKSGYANWPRGFCQALHYAKKGLHFAP